MKREGKKYIKSVANSLLLLFIIHCSLFTLTSCGVGDDEGGIQLGDLIVGTWLRGWDEGDVVIEGDSDYNPEDFSHDMFVFRGDGKYNGRVRDGSFVCLGVFGDTIYNGTYRCDNYNMKLVYRNEQNSKITLLGQVLSFTPEEIWLKFDYDDPAVTVRMKVRRMQDQQAEQQ